MVGIYPACFYPDDDGVTVIFHDLPGCTTFGKDIEEAFLMADEAGCGWIYGEIVRGEPVPPPSNLADVKADDFEDGFVSLIRLDIDAYAEKYHSKSVRKNCTVPAWLATLAERKGFNFSILLQDAIKQNLDLA
ncbi:MAG: type II toxin-antitoxin system HicB family antitoxin [Ruminococcus sp.]|jgi:predicted RNase H-like HicB family nuclease|nr:type II toxin-antitoxin system HicB family antitoxin [Ruminococcus sp.]